MHDVIERLRAVNPVISCEPPHRSVLDAALMCDAPPLRDQRGRWRSPLGVAVCIVAVIVPLAVFVGAVGTLSHGSHSPGSMATRRMRQPSAQRTVTASPSGAAKPAGERRMLDLLGVLARPATTADRAILSRVRRAVREETSSGQFGRVDYSTVRIVGRIAGGLVEALVAVAPVGAPSLRLPADKRAGLQNLEDPLQKLEDQWRVVLVTLGPHSSGVEAGPAGASQIKRGGLWVSGRMTATGTAWAMIIVVPDGVARIVARGAAGPPITLTVHDNVAIRAPLRGTIRWPRTQIWFGRSGGVVKRIRL